jgi:invasion protein IalB
MVKLKQETRRLGALFGRGAVGLAFMAGMALSVPAFAQDAPAEAAKEPQDAWVKLCEQATSLSEEGKTLNVCLTHHERIDGNTGRVLVSAAMRQVEGQDQRTMMVMVPLGMALPAGVQVKIDENEPIKLRYTICHIGGCTAEVEATQEIVNQFQAGQQLIVAAVNIAGKPIGFPVPLTGFTKAYNGEPVDNEKYRTARRQLMETIQQRQAALVKQAQEEAARSAQQPPQ